MRTLLPLLAAAALSASDSTVIDATKRPMLGVEMTPPTSDVIDREGLAPGQGVLVQGVFKDTAASSMGLGKGDVILGVNGLPVTSMTDLRNEVGLSQPGDPVEVMVRRNGETIALRSDLKPWPESIPYAPLDAAAEKRFRDWQDRRQARLADDAKALRDQIGDLKRRLDPAAEPTGPGEAGAPDAGIGLPAWRLALRVPSAPQPPAEPDDIVPGTALRDQLGDGRAWIARVHVTPQPAKNP